MNNDIFELRKFRYHIVHASAFKTVAEYITRHVYVMEDGYVRDDAFFSYRQYSLLTIDLSDEDICYLKLSGAYIAEVQLLSLSYAIQTCLVEQLLSIAERKQMLIRQNHDERIQLLEKHEKQLQEKLSELQYTCKHTYVAEATRVVPWITRYECSQCSAYYVHTDTVIKSAHIHEYK